VKRPTSLEPGLVIPGRSHGLLDVPRWRFLLSLLVKKELRVRYRGSALGLLWSYVKPGVQLIVFYIAMGKFLGLERGIPNFVIYLFSGMVIVNFFGEVFGNTTKSIVVNADLVKKIYLPRELFPVASVWVAFIHLLPQLVVLIVAALVSGWRPGLLNIAAIVGALVLTVVFALGLGLMFGAFNVLFRDAENFVELILMMAAWVSPVLYTWAHVATVIPDSLDWVYKLYPITAAVELNHVGFWIPTAAVAERYPQGTGPLIDSLPMWAGAALVLSVLWLVVGQTVFSRLESRFAQEL